jgi:chemotaxis protein CheX
MLREVINVMGEPDSSITMMKDLLGEMANTISGNARTEFGSEFIISTPQIVESAPSVSYLPRDRQSYITPFTWRGYKAVIGICIA